MGFLKQGINLLQPLPLLWIGLLILAASLARRQQWQPFRLAAGLWLFISLTTCLPTCSLLLASIEKPWRSIAGRWDELPVGDAIVCLGGGASVSPLEITGVGMQGASDRPTTAIELLRRNKAPRLLIGGGSDPGETPEADGVKAWFTLWQLSPAEIISLGHCLDTHDEAEKVAALARQHGWKRVLLVTSASHMKRAQAVFQKSIGIEIIAVPCAFEVENPGRDWIFFPSIGELNAFAIWFHEVIGWWAYRARGWI